MQSRRSIVPTPHLRWVQVYRSGSQEDALQQRSSLSLQNVKWMYNGRHQKSHAILEIFTYHNGGILLVAPPISLIIIFGFQLAYPLIMFWRYLMESMVFIIFALFGFIVIPAVIAITGVIGGFVTAKIMQRVNPKSATSDVGKVTGMWAKGGCLGAMFGSIFFGIATGSTFWFNYLETGIYTTVGLAIVGFFTGEFGAKPMFQFLEEISPRSGNETDI